MNTITEHQLRLLNEKVYELLVSNPDVGLGDLNDCVDAASNVITEWLDTAEIKIAEEEEDNRHDPNEVVKRITDFVNTFSIKQNEFNAAMNKEHRTLQQSFTRLCLKWIEFCTTEGYRVDGRNAASKDVAQRIVERFKKDNEGFKPSEYLGYI